MSKISEGMAGCAKFSIDGNWYRVVVKKILEKRSLSQKLLVEYVDYGNEEEIDRFKLRRALDTELYSLPHQVRCLDRKITEPLVPNLERRERKGRGGGRSRREGDLGGKG